MNPQQYPPTPPPTNPAQKPINPLSVMQPGEQTLYEMKRHPIGIIGIFIGPGLLLVILAVLIVAAPHFITAVDSSKILAIGFAAYAVFALLCLAFVWVANKVYWGNRWILTTDSLTQVTQRSLFDKQSSQLSLGNLEDVTAEQNGIFPHMFNYGKIKVETAGERSKFVFMFCPDPNGCAKQILSARERFEQGRRAAEPQALYRGEGAYQTTAGAVPLQQQPAPYAQPVQPVQDPTKLPPAYPMPPQDNGVNTNTQQ